jgi:hypothetical protein
MAEYLAAEHRDSWTRGDDGWRDDWSACLSPWGFDLSAIRALVLLWHGLADTRCPPGHSRWLADQIPHVTAISPSTKTTPTSRRTTAATPTPGCRRVWGQSGAYTNRTKRTPRPAWLSGLFFPLTWVLWYVLDERAAGGRATRQLRREGR